MAGKSQRREIGRRDLDAELLGKLADQRFLRPLARLDLAAREFPKPGKRAPLRALGDQDPALAIEENASRDQNERSCRGRLPPPQDR